MKRISIVSQKKAVSQIPPIINSETLCYYLTDDYDKFISLQSALADRIQIKNLSGIFHKTFQEIKKPFLELIADINKKYDSLEWWSGRIASRNTASTSLLHNITYLFCAKKILSNSKGDEDIIFVVHSQALSECITTIATKAGYKVINYSRNNKYFEILRLWSYYAAQIFYFSWYSLQTRRAAFELLERLPVKKNQSRKRVVIRSMITGGNFDKSGRLKDRNFGSLPDWLSSKNYEVWTLPIFFNLSMSIKEIYTRLKQQEKPFLIPDHYLKFSDYLGVLYNCYKILRKQIENAEIEKTDIAPIFNEVLSKTGFAPSLSILNLCYPMLKRLKERGFEIDGFYYPFENNPSEKLFILGCRKYFPSSSIIGFQHTTFFPNQLAYHLDHTEKDYHPFPDKIVCSGPIYIKMHEEAGFPPDILTFGPNLRFESVYLKKTDIRDIGYDGEKILLLPLTFSHDLAYEVFIKVKNALENLKDYKVYIKTHPLLSKEALVKFLEKIRLNNSEFTDDGIIQDWLAKTYAVISTGGSITILESLVMGIPVIRVIPDNTFFFDPFDYPDYPLKPINTSSEIRRQLQLIDDINDKEKEIFKKIAERALREYFTKPTEENLEVFL